MDIADRPLATEVGLHDHFRDGWFNGKTAELKKGLAVRSTDTVIDVGCGDEAITGFCAGQGAGIVVIDVSDQRLAATEARVRNSPAHAYQAIHSTCDPIPLTDAAGDLVVCCEFLQRVSDAERLLKELVRLVKPGGQLLIRVPDSRAEEFVAATAPAYYFQPPNHVRIFAAGELRALLLDAGLQIESEQFLGCFWSMYLPLFWLAVEPGEGVSFDKRNPITDHWTSLWHELQRHPKGEILRDALNGLLPRSHCIVARKPG